MDLGIAGRTAIVGGSSRGLGRGCADALAEAGVNLVICARHEDQLHAAADEIERTTGAQVLPVAVDLTCEEDGDRLVEETSRRFGMPDILVNNIGGPPPGGFFDHDEEQFRAACERLLMYPLRMLKLCIPHMRQQRWGRIVNITSMSVREPMPNLILSGVFRTGLVSMCRAMSNDLAAENVLINNLAPGSFDTERSREILQERAEKTGRPMDELRSEAVKDTPMGRFLRPEELGWVAAFLCSEKASAITGATFPVDGGAGHGLF